MKKFMKGILVALCATVGLSAGAAAGTLSAPVDVETAYAETSYTTKDIAMMGRIAGWYGNGNFEIRLTLGELDHSGASVQKTPSGNLATMLEELDFFNHIEIAGKTLAEWGCTSCYENWYKLNSGEPDYTFMVPLSMSSASAAEAGAAGAAENAPVTIKEGALIPSDAYLQGDATATVYRAGCDFVTMESGVAYGMMAVAKTEVESIKYVAGWDSTYNNAYLGVSLKGDDYEGNGSQTERHPDYYSDVYTTNHYSNKLLADGVVGKAESYGLFNLGSKGKGYFSFVFRANEAETESITIPAGTLFPSQAMKTLFDVNNNPVYIMYETQSDVTFYKQPDGSWNTAYADTATSISSAFVDGTTDSFTVLKLSTHDYPDSLDNWGGTAVTVKQFLANSNFYSHVLIDGVELGSTGEAYLNVWGNKGAICFRTSAGSSATKIQVLKGCEIPSYAELSTGERKRFVTTETVTFMKNKAGEFVLASEDIASYIAQASETLDAYKAGLFYEAEDAKRAEIIATAKANLTDLFLESDVDAVVNEAKAAIDMLFTKDEMYVSQDVAMMGRVAGWHGNGNFEIRITLGACDWDGISGQQSYNGELKTLLAKLDFFNHIKLAGKTLAEWGCTACYDNFYTLGSGGPQYTIMIPLTMSRANMEAATAAGAKADAPITIMKDAIIPGYGYLTKTSNVVYRAGCEYVTSNSTVDYGIEAVAKTTIDSLKYVQSYDGTCGYFGVSFVGDDYLGNGTQLEVNPNYYFDNKFSETILVNGESGKVKYYGLFNLGEAGKGYYAFQMFVPEEELVSITIPAGTRFPSRAMTDLSTANSDNHVYIMYELESDITLYNSSNGFVSYAEYMTEQVTGYKAGLFREAEETQRLAIVANAVESLKSLSDKAAIDAVVASAKASIDALKTNAEYAAEELAAVKAAANAEVAGYKADVAYLAEQAQARTDAINAAKAKIEEAITEEAINTAVVEAKAAIDALATKESIVNAAIAEVDAYKADEVYMDEQAAEKAAAVATAKEAIANATSQAAIDTAVSDMKVVIDQIKTKAQLDAEALAAKKATANATIDNLKKAIDFDLYEDEAIMTINTLYATAKAAIENAETQEAVDEAVAAFEAALNEVPMKSTDNGGNDVDNGQTGEMTTGCFGTVSGLSMGVLLLGFVSTVLLKKKED